MFEYSCTVCTQLATATSRRSFRPAHTQLYPVHCLLRHNDDILTSDIKYIHASHYVIVSEGSNKYVSLKLVFILSSQGTL